METYKVRTALDELLDAADAKEALRELTFKAEDESCGPFERYAGSVLRDAGALALTEPIKPSIRIRRIADGQLVRLFTSSMPPGSVNKPLQVLEDALNRLLGVRDALENGIGAQVAASFESPSTFLRNKYARHGVEYPLWSDPTRGAHVTLPAIAINGVPTCAYFYEVDWRMLDNVASIAHLHYQSTILANSNQVVFGVKGPHGSEWDVRTRLASTLGNLWTSLHFSCQFDCDLSRGVATVHFSIPAAESFPTQVASQWESGFEPVGNRMDDARTVYALRLAALLAATCFGAGRSVERAFVVGKDAQTGLAVSCAFERDQFVHETLPAIDAGRVASPDLRFDVEGVECAIRASQSVVANPGNQAVPQGVLANTRVEPHEDVRVLPDDLQRLFHAKRVLDIDVSSHPDEEQRILDEALEDADRFTTAAIASLESLVDELEALLMPPDDQPDARPLHCGTALRRLAIALLDEDLRIGADAEAFLSFEDEQPASLPDIYYFRAPGFLFDAHAGLADLYHATGEYRAAEKQANRCIALAPTTPTGFVMKAKVLSALNRRQEAANVIREGLRGMLSDDDRALMMHELALALKRIGRVYEAEALHIYASSLMGVYATKSLDIVKGFAGTTSTRAFVHANLSEAKDIVRELEVPVALERVRQVLISRAALGLVNAHAPNAAAPYAALLAGQFPTNRAIISACDSIQRGVDGRM